MLEVRGLSCARGERLLFSDVSFSLKPGEWLRIEITATTGAAKYDVTLTRQDGTKTKIEAIPCKPTWDSAHYLLFSALGTTKTAFFIDNVKLENSGN